MTMVNAANEIRVSANVARLCGNEQMAIGLEMALEILKRHDDAPPSERGAVAGPAEPVAARRRWLATEDEIVKAGWPDGERQMDLVSLANSLGRGVAAVWHRATYVLKLPARAMDREVMAKIERGML